MSPIQAQNCYIIELNIYLYIFVRRLASYQFKIFKMCEHSSFCTKFLLNCHFDRMLAFLGFEARRTKNHLHLI